MKASKKNPIYTAYIVAGNTKYDISPVVTKYDSSDQKKQMAQAYTIELVNVKVGGTRLSKLLDVRNRVYVYADDGERSEEVYRGYIWTLNSKDQLGENTLTLKCYDNLIYFQESDDSEFFSSGKSTETICSSLCDKWGVKLKYAYSSITHSKMALRGKLSDIFISDILEPVKKQTGEKFVVRSEKDEMNITTVGSNTRIYTIKVGGNAEGLAEERTMDGVITKVIILGKADGDDRRPVEATVSGKTSEYGTIQKIVNLGSNTSKADATKEAQTTIDENGEPKSEYAVKAPDIPWIRKGDKVKVEGIDWDKYFIVVDIDREISKDAKTMTLTLEDV